MSSFSFLISTNFHQQMRFLKKVSNRSLSTGVTCLTFVSLVVPAILMGKDFFTVNATRHQIYFQMLLELRATVRPSFANHSQHEILFTSQNALAE